MQYGFQKKYKTDVLKLIQNLLLSIPLEMIKDKQGLSCAKLRTASANY